MFHQLWLEFMQFVAQLPLQSFSVMMLENLLCIHIYFYVFTSWHLSLLFVSRLKINFWVCPIIFLPTMLRPFLPPEQLGIWQMPMKLTTFKLGLFVVVLVALWHLRKKSSLKRMQMREKLFHCFWTWSGIQGFSGMTFSDFVFNQAEVSWDLFPNKITWLYG